MYYLWLVPSEITWVSILNQCSVFQVKSVIQFKIIILKKKDQKLETNISFSLFIKDLITCLDIL